MRHPPYPLRPNKAIDRYLLIEAIKLLGRKEDLSKFTYFGFGGPYLEDFKLLHENFPKIKMVSIEQDSETHKRQMFHLPCSGIKLLHRDFRSFLAQEDLEKARSIFWIDYIALEYSAFEEFQELLDKVAPGSLIKITLRADPGYYDEKKDAEDFKKKFAAVLPDHSTVPPPTSDGFAQLLQDMIQIAAQQALPTATEQTFQPIYSSFYSDGTGMFSICGMVCQREDLVQVRTVFEEHRFANLDWKRPIKLSVPFLSTKERLRLQEHLPCPTDAGAALSKVLGYLIDNGKKVSEKKLEEYAQFYRYYPYFIKAIP